MRGISGLTVQQQLIAGAAIVIVASASPAMAQTRTFNVPAGPASSTIPTFAKQAGVQILASGDAVRAKRTKQVKGTYSVNDGLRLLLQGTGLEASSDGPTGIITVRRAPETATSAAGEAASSLGDSSGGDETDPDSSDIVVTGSHIVGAPKSSPVNVVGRGQIEREGYASIGEVMRKIPQNFSGGNSPQVTIGNAPGGFGGRNSGDTAGVTPNLRGLGAASTLTLVNGVRLADDTASGAVDISLIPVEVIERIEIVPDGASAIYGSDAVAGVVNIILRKKFDGIQTNAQAGVATDGGGFEWRTSQLAGTSWATGGIVAAFEHYEANPVRATQRDFSTADNPTHLLPPLNRESAFVTANQDIAPGLSVAVDGLATWRESSRVQTNNGVGTFGRFKVRQMQIAPRISLDLGSSWNVRAVGSFSRERFVNSGYFLIDGTQYPNDPVENVSRRLSGELQVTGDLLQLPAGALRTAFGIGTRRERFIFRPVGTDADPQRRTINFLYGEVALPLLAGGTDGVGRLDLDLSGRYEDYSDFGGSFVPKVGALFHALPKVRLRATWGKSFRAPTLDESAFATSQAAYIDFPDPLAPSGVSPVLVTLGGNPNLGPERATTWSTGVDFDPAWLGGGKVSVTAFGVRYKDRIRNINDFFSALTDPNNVGFVRRNPTVQQVLDRVDSVQTFFNFTDRIFDPAAVVALITGEPINLVRQKVFGIDANASARFLVGNHEFEPFLSATYLSLREQVFRTLPEFSADGKVFNPPTFRGRGGVNWSSGPISAVVAVNYTDGFDNPNSAASPRVSSWTTADIALTAKGQGHWEGLRATLSIDNAFDRRPPFVDYNALITGVNYDSTNATPRGRFISLILSHAWGK